MKYKPMPMKVGEYEALVKLLDYSKADEYDHWYTLTDKTNHVYNDILTLEGYVDKCKHKEVPDEDV